MSTSKVNGLLVLPEQEKIVIDVEGQRLRWIWVRKKEDEDR